MTEQETSRSAQQVQAEEERMAQRPSRAWQTCVGVAIVLAAVCLAWGTWQIPAQIGAEDGGARLMPGLCAAVLLLCGVWLLWEARHGGWRNAAALSGHAGLQVMPWVWVSAGLLLSTLLLRHSGFVLAAALCYALAVQGLRLAAQPQWRIEGKRLAVDVCVGLVLAAVVYAVFTEVWGVALPAGWLSWT